MPEQFGYFGVVYGFDQQRLFDGVFLEIEMRQLLVTVRVVWVGVVRVQRIELEIVGIGLQIDDDANSTHELSN